MVEVLMGYIAVGALAALLSIYLIYTILHPEKF